MPDVIGFLSLAGEEWEIACATVKRADQLQLERRGEEWKAVIKALASAVGAATGNAVGQAFRP